MSKVKVYGIQRSGNNWLMWMLEANYRVKVMGSNYGWTHGAYSDDKEVEDALNIVISKHPIEWLPSMQRFHKKHHGLTLGQFIRDSDSIEQWNSLYLGHISNAEKYKARFVRYDDLLRDPETVLDNLIDGAFQRKDRPFRSAENQHMSTRMKPTSREFDKNQYLEKHYLKKYTKEELEEVTSRIDWGVAGSLGYEKEKI